MKITVQSYITAVVNREIEVSDNCTYDELLAAAKVHANSRISDSDMIVGYLDDEEIDRDDLSASFDEAKNVLLGVDADYTEVVLQNLTEEDAKNPDGPWPPKTLCCGDKVIVRDWFNQLNTGTVVSVQIGEPVAYCKGSWQAASQLPTNELAGLLETNSGNTRTATWPVAITTYPDTANLFIQPRPDEQRSTN